jgi:hypothetical protein
MRALLAALTLVLLVACGSAAAPARQALADIAGTLSVFGGEAALREPAQYAQVEERLGELRARYDRGEFRAVVAGAPAVRAAVSALRARVDADRAAALAGQNAEWAHYAAVLPDQFAAIERRLAQVAPARPHAPSRAADDEAQRGVRAAVALWSKAQSAFASGNLAEALQAAHDVQERADALQASLR